MNVFFLLRSLERGGSERQVVTLARGLARRGHQVRVAVFYDKGVLERELAEAGVPVIHLGKSGRWAVYGMIRRLRESLDACPPDVLYSCLAGPNMCAVAARMLRRRPLRVVFRIASSYVDLKRYDLFTRLTYRAEALAARFADLLIANSRGGARNARAWGVSANRVVVLPNGFDTRRLRRDAMGGKALREQWGIAPDVRLIGLVARLDPMKDHPNFLAAAARLRQPGVRFVCVGGGDGRYLAQMRRLSDQLGLEDRVTWVGEAGDMPAVYSALDIATCASYGEGFPNVVGEAMACETPCVVTDVGDCAWIVDDPRLVVPPRDPEALVDAWFRLLARLDREGATPGRQARQRIVEAFSEDRLIADSESVLLNLIGKPVNFANG